MASVDKIEEEVESDDDSDQGSAENQNRDQESVDYGDQGSNGKKKGIGLSRATQDRAIAKAKKVLVIQFFYSLCVLINGYTFLSVFVNFNINLDNTS